MAVTREELLTFLTKKVRRKDRAKIQSIEDDVALFSSGTIDSFVMADLANWLQKKAKRRPDASDLESLDTIAGILKFAEGK